MTGFEKLTQMLDPAKEEEREKMIADTENKYKEAYKDMKMELKKSYTFFPRHLTKFKHVGRLSNLNVLHLFGP